VVPTPPEAEPIAVRLREGNSRAQLVLYDNFGKGTIDPAKWWGGNADGGPDSPPLNPFD
jgi:hypothetical protein